MLVPSARTSARVDGGGAEGLPHDRLTDVGCDEERDTGAQTVALLEQLVQQQDDQTGDKELKEKTDGRFVLRRINQPFKQPSTTKHFDSHNQCVSVWIF